MLKVISRASFRSSNDPPADAFEPIFGVFGAEANRGEQHLEVNYELAARSRHSQRNLTF
jgi:hypothetical protein